MDMVKQNMIQRAEFIIEFRSNQMDYCVELAELVLLHFKTCGGSVISPHLVTQVPPCPTGEHTGCGGKHQ